MTEIKDEKYLNCLSDVKICAELTALSICKLLDNLPENELKDFEVENLQNSVTFLNSLVGFAGVHLVKTSMNNLHKTITDLNEEIKNLNKLGDDDNDNDDKPESL